MSAMTSPTLADRRWSVGIAVATFAAGVVSVCALTAYLLDQPSPWLLGISQFVVLVAMLAWLKAILMPPIRSRVRLWLAPLTAATLIVLYLTLATPG